MIEKVEFNRVFRENPNGSLTPVRKIHINGMAFDSGVSSWAGNSFGGVDFMKHKDKDLAIEDRGSYVEIMGIYQ